MYSVQRYSATKLQGLKNPNVIGKETKNNNVTRVNNIN